MEKKQISSMLLAGAFVLTSGCASKTYVRRTVDPVSNRVDQLANQAGQQGQTLEATRRDVEKNANDISAARETAKGADLRAAEAMSAATAAGSKADQNSRSLESLRGTVANLDDYKPASAVVVTFGFNKFNLTNDGKTELDKLGQSKDQWKRYFIAVEGFTDRIGTENYNDVLSRRRADKVVQYLVSKYEIPIYRIHQIGLGKEKPVDEGRDGAARARNRRVEVTVYSADASNSMSSTAPAK